MTKSAEETLIDRIQGELTGAEGWNIQFQLDLLSASCIVGNLQLAISHPENTGPAAEVARKLIADIRRGLGERGFLAHVAMIDLGELKTRRQTPV